MAQSQVIALSKLVTFSIVLALVGFTLVIVGLAFPPVVGTDLSDVRSGYSFIYPNIRTDPNPLQLPFLVAGVVVLIAGLSFLSLQLFRRQSAKTFLLP
jgi:hypothetical protein